MSTTAEPIELTRDCAAVQIPAGHTVTLVKGTKAVITQSLGGSFTLHVPSFGGLFRVSGKDADAVGKPPTEASQPATASPDEGKGGLEQQVWEQLKTCFDPEIPVNIVDLGLVYEMRISPLPNEANRVDVKMTLTAPGCGMGTMIAADAREKILKLPGVQEANVDVIWNPPWNRDMVSPAGKAILGIK
jgi:probable FeS assembly SUF system protein SufT